MTAALEGAPAGSLPLVIGDLNSDLDFPRDRQEEILSATMRERGMRCASRCYRPKRTRRTRGRWTWRQRRGVPGSGQRQWLRSRPDYFLFREKDRRRIKCCRWIQPRHHNSDHRALVVDIKARPGEIARYVEGRVRLPVQPPPPEEQTKGEKLFAELCATVEEVPRRERKDLDWVRDGTWRLVDQRNSLRKQGRLSIVQGRRLGRRI